MINQGAILRYVTIVMAAVLMAGCASPGPRSAYLEEISPASITNLTAYCNANTINIRYPLKGWNAFAHGSWLPVQTNNADFECQFAVLTFQRQKSTVRKSVISPGNQLVVCDSKQWDQLVLGVFAAMAPDKPEHGALLLNQQMELVLYRDAAGIVKAVPIDDKPSYITVDRTFNDRDFSQTALRLLASHINVSQPNQKRFLFVTGEDPAFVLIEPKERLVVFLAYPKEPEATHMEIPGRMGLRAVNSLLIKSFLLTAIKNPVTLISRGIWTLGNSGMTLIDAIPDPPSAPPPPLYQGPGMDLNAWEKELDGIVWARRHGGQAQFFVDGKQFFPDLIQSIENARRTVDVMVYIFDTDNYAIEFANILKQVSHNVRVRVMADDLGSSFAQGAPASSVPPDFKPPGDITSYLETDSKVHVRLNYDPWLATDHRKCYIIDSHKAYVGGMNIGWVYRYQWHDLMLSLTGPVVGRLEKDYRKAWAFSGPLGDLGYAWASLFDREHLRRNSQPGDIDIRVLRTATGKLQIYKAQLAAIRRAKRYIYIENAYFNDDTIYRELVAARLRGVDVRVILPSENDVSIMQTGNRIMANKMISHGIRVYLYPGMTHVKAAVYDGWACVGSANFEKMSLRVSQEMDVAFSDPNTVSRLEQQLFIPDFSRAQELKTPLTLNWWDPFVKALGNQL